MICLKVDDIEAVLVVSVQLRHVDRHFGHVAAPGHEKPLAG